MKKINKLICSFSIVSVLMTPFITSSLSVYAGEAFDPDKIIVDQIKNEMQEYEISETYSVSPELSDFELELFDAYQGYQRNRAGNLTEEQFVEYVFEQGIKEDTPQTREAVSKAFVRYTMKDAAAAVRVLGLYPFAAELLDHSCQDNPSKMVYNQGTTRSNQIMQSSKYQSMVNNMKNSLRYETSDYWSAEGSLTLNTPTDLLLSLNKVDYTAAAEKVNGRWDLYIRISDVYDFEYQEWMGAPGLSGSIVTAINNYGAMAYSIGAINDFVVLAYTKVVV